MRYLPLVILIISTSTNAIGITPTPGSVITSTSGSVTNTNNTATITANANEAVNKASADTATALGKVWPNCDEKVNNAVIASTEGQRNVFDKNIDEVKKSVNEVKNCLATYKDFKPNINFNVPTASALLAAATAMACNAINGVAGTISSNFNKGIYYNNGILSSSVNTSILNGRGSGSGVSINGEQVLKPSNKTSTGGMPSAL